MVLTTLPNRELAAALARDLVEQRLAACVQMESIDSVYRWDGALCAEPEVRLTCKTTAARAPDLAAAIRARHPYAVPELLTVVIEQADPAYAQWVADACQSG